MKLLQDMTAAELDEVEREALAMVRQVVHERSRRGRPVLPVDATPCWRCSERAAFDVAWLNHRYPMCPWHLNALLSHDRGIVRRGYAVTIERRPLDPEGIFCPDCQTVWNQYAMGNLLCPDCVEARRQIAQLQSRPLPMRAVAEYARVRQGRPVVVADESVPFTESDFDRAARDLQQRIERRRDGKTA